MERTLIFSLTPGIPTFRQHTSDDQFDLHAGRTCFIQGTDNILVAEGVHLRNDMSILSLQRIIFLTLDQVQELILQP